MSGQKLFAELVGGPVDGMRHDLEKSVVDVCGLPDGVLVPYVTMTVGGASTVKKARYRRAVPWRSTSDGALVYEFDAPPQPPPPVVPPAPPGTFKLN